MGGRGFPYPPTILLGHTRWRTRGDERINRNNHPIRAGDIIGTHNGTIYNADYLFRRFKLRRFAQVDSELLFRLAHNAVRDDLIDMERFRARLELCRGQITAVLASRLDPETILVLKGNKPLELRINRRHRAVLYASDPAFPDAVLADERGCLPRLRQEGDPESCLPATCPRCRAAGGSTASMASTRAVPACTGTDPGVPRGDVCSGPALCG